MVSKNVLFILSLLIMVILISAREISDTSSNSKAAINSGKIQIQDKDDPAYSTDCFGWFSGWWHAWFGWGEPGGDMGGGGKPGGKGGDKPGGGHGSGGKPGGGGYGGDMPGGGGYGGGGGY